MFEIYPKQYLAPFKNKKIIIAITGAIAAYKIYELARALVNAGAIVQIVLTKSAKDFVSILTFEALTNRKVFVDIYGKNITPMEHIELARWADLFLIAPLSANTLAKLAGGFCENMLEALALVYEKPLLLSPSMNHSMYKNPATQKNIKFLKEQRHIFITPDEGNLACGERGVGRLCDYPKIISTMLKNLYPAKNKLKVVINFGATIEKIDPVRYISNFSSGKMGFALGFAFSLSCTDVVLIGQKNSLPLPPNVKIINIESAKQMQEAIEKEIENTDIFIGAAAICDYRVKNPAQEKIKKEENTENLQLDLIKNQDLIKDIALNKKIPYVVGFAAQSCDLEKYAKEKLVAKNLDLVLANDISKPDRGFKSDKNSIVLISKTDKITYELCQKQELAYKLKDEILTRFRGKKNA